MNLTDDILVLRDAALGASDFEALATRLLELCLDRTASWLRRARLPDARLVGGLLHLRPSGGAYRSLVTVISDDDGPVERITPSSTVWSVVDMHRLPVRVDVLAGLAQPLGELPERLVARAQATVGGTDNFASRQEMLSRQVTHILAIPLRGPGGRVDGMVAIESEIFGMLAEDFVDDATLDSLQLLVDVATPSLLALPLRDRPTRPSGTTAPDALLPVIGGSMRRVIDLLAVFSEQDETILLSGPTGSGKSRLGRWCHSRSRRADGPFESVDLLTVPDDMQMAELFGWSKGAFTGAVRDQPGLVERAEGGTLFIDEIDKLSMKAQAGLLRFLERREFRRLGDPVSVRTSNLRIIVGTNVDLHERVVEGEFRSDLYYRINVLPVTLPPLRDRKDEIADWARVFLTRRHSDTDTDTDAPASLSRDALRSLIGFDWPGNLRQLDNVVRRAYAIALTRRDEAGLVIDQEDLERALAFDRKRTADASLLDAVRAAAWAFIEEAHARGSLAIDHADAFRGLVLAAALELTGSREEAMHLIEREQLLSGRNHHKYIKRELARVAELYEALDAEFMPPADT